MADMTNITAKQVQATIEYVKSLAAGRTRYEGAELYRDEILVGEIERLRAALNLIRSQVHNLPRSATADRIATICGDAVET